MSPEDFEAYCLAQVNLVSSMSTCLTRSTGAIVVRDRRMIATGFNGNVPGALHCKDGGCLRCAAAMENRRTGQGLASGTDLEICTCVHAEVNAVAQCARYGSPTAGTTIYSTTKPCLDCAKLMAVAGVTTVVYGEDYPSVYDEPPTMSMRKFRV